MYNIIKKYLDNVVLNNEIDYELFVELQGLGYNPYRAKNGRFAPGPKKMNSTIQGIGTLANKNQLDYKTKDQHLELTPEGKVILDNKIKGISSSVESNLDGYKQLGHDTVTSTKQWADMTGCSENISQAVMGIRHKDSIKLSPKVTSSLAGNDEELDISIGPMGIFGKLKYDAEDFRKSAEHTVIHEQTHARERKYEIPFEGKDNAGVDPRKYSLTLEEASNEVITRAISHRSGVMTVEDSTRLGAYHEEVYLIAKEAKARYPDDPNKALQWISTVHKTGLTADGIRESFNGVVYTGGYGWPRSLHSPFGKMDAAETTEWVRGNTSFNQYDYKKTVGWLYSKDDGSFKLEIIYNNMYTLETTKVEKMDNLQPPKVIVNNNKTALDLLYEGKYKEALAKMLKTSGRIDMKLISDFIENQKALGNDVSGLVKLIEN